MDDAAMSGLVAEHAGRAEKALRNFLVTYRNATATERPAVEALWNESGVGPFPHEQVTKPRS